jgi:anti-sigma factor RsiW
MTYHTPYENWIFQQDELSMDERLQLYEHLETCQTCSELEKSWRGIERAFVRSEVVDAPEGFTTRWRESIRPRLELNQRDQAFKAFVGFSGALFVCLVVLGFQFLQHGSPMDWMFGTMQDAVRFLIFSIQLVNAAMIWLQSIPPIVTVPFGFLALAGCGVLIILWVYWVGRISKKRSAQQ